jgi:hypothetical protein
VQKEVRRDEACAPASMAQRERMQHRAVPPAHRRCGRLQVFEAPQQPLVT